MAGQYLGARGDRAQWLVPGLVMGIGAGIIFAMFEMIVAALMGDGFFMPLRMIGAIILGEEALQPSFSLITAAITGMVLHLVLSAIYGVIFAVIVSNISALRANRSALVATGAVYGFLLWIINFFAIAPTSFAWFGMANDVVQFVAHTFFYGAALGLLLTLSPSVTHAE